MRKIIFALASASAAVLAVDTNAVSYVAGEDSTAQITPAMRQSAAALFGDGADGLLHAVGLTMRKYDMDMQSESGRRAWHGKLVSEYVDTNLLFKISVYSNSVDGAVWTYRQPFTPVKKTASRRTVVAMTNGVPARLAAARAARAAAVNAGTAVTNVVTEVR